MDGADLNDLAGFFRLELAREAYGIAALVLAGGMFRAFAQVRHGQGRCARDGLFQDASDIAPFSRAFRSEYL